MTIPAATVGLFKIDVKVITETRELLYTVQISSFQKSFQNSYQGKFPLSSFSQLEKKSEMVL